MHWKETNSENSKELQKSFFVEKNHLQVFLYSLFCLIITNVFLWTTTLLLHFFWTPLQVYVTTGFVYLLLFVFSVDFYGTCTLAFFLSFILKLINLYHLLDHLIAIRSNESAALRNQERRGHYADEIDLQLFLFYFFRCFCFGSIL